jgi:hypothetical protein
MKVKEIEEECVRERNVCDEESITGRIFFQVNRPLE